MKQSFLCIFCILIIFTTRGSFLLAEETPDQIQVPVGTMTLQAPAHFQTKKTPVIFEHSTHLKFSCMACHHDWDRSGPVEGCMTSGCHEQLMPAPPTGKRTQGKKIPSITGAYHMACRGCHREQLSQNMGGKYIPPTGPIACEGCHPGTFTPSDGDALDSFDLPLGNITIDPPEGVDAKRASVDFPHTLHFDQDCQVCHHDWDATQDIENCTTSGCHDELEPEKSNRSINNPNNSMYFLTAYHKACLGCHMDLKKQKEMLLESAMGTEAPVRCDGCHNL
jgi:hypothetical protein